MLCNGGTTTVNGHVDTIRSSPPRTPPDRAAIPVMAWSLPGGEVLANLKPSEVHGECGHSRQARVPRKAPRSLQEPPGAIHGVGTANPPSTPRHRVLEVRRRPGQVELHREIRGVVSKSNSIHDSDLSTCLGHHVAGFPDHRREVLAEETLLDPIPLDPPILLGRTRTIYALWFDAGDAITGWVPWHICGPQTSPAPSPRTSTDGTNFPVRPRRWTWGGSHTTWSRDRPQPAGSPTGIACTVGWLIDRGGKFGKRRGCCFVVFGLHEERTVERDEAFPATWRTATWRTERAYSAPTRRRASRTSWSQSSTRPTRCSVSGTAKTWSRHVSSRCGSSGMTSARTIYVCGCSR